MATSAFRILKKAASVMLDCLEVATLGTTALVLKRDAYFTFSGSAVSASDGKVYGSRKTFLPVESEK